MILYTIDPFSFSALHEYKPKSPIVFGISLSVLMSFMKLTPAKIGWPCFNQVKFADGLASTAHVKVVVWLIQDFMRGSVVAVLLM